jgi:hypothetical protein
MAHHLSPNDSIKLVEITDRQRIEPSQYLLSISSHRSGLGLNLLGPSHGNILRRLPDRFLDVGRE